MIDPNSQLESLIQLIKKIKSQENFDIYENLIRSLELCNQHWHANSFEKCASEIAYCIRMVMEAPSKSTELGLALLEGLDEIYKNLTS